MIKTYIYPDIGGKPTDSEKLKSGSIDSEDYEKMQGSIVIACHDVFIESVDPDNPGILLVKRKREPAKGLYWPVGGRVERGVTEEDSLKKRVKEEVGLYISNIEFLGIGRTWFPYNAFDNSKGTDSRNTVYYAKGYGQLELDRDHEKHIIVPREKYHSEFREKLTEYVTDFMDLIIRA